MARAEDLNVTCVLTNGPNFNGGIDPAGDARHLIHYGMEYRSALYGHMGLLGMKQPHLHRLLPAGLPGVPAQPRRSAMPPTRRALPWSPRTLSPWIPRCS